MNKKRASKKIPMCAISPATKENLDLMKNKPVYPFDEILAIPKDKFNFSSDLAIYDDKIALASIDDELGIIIENKEMAEIIRSCFKLAREEARRLNMAKSKRVINPKIS